MRGHVRRRGSGWSFVVDAGRDSATGKRRQRWSSGHRTRRDAEQALRTALQRVDVGQDPLPAEITVADFILKRWLPHLESQRKPRPNTVRRYRILLRVHVVPVIGGLRLDRVTPGAVQAALDAMTARGLAPRTVAQARAATSSAFTSAMRWGLLTVNPVRATQTPTPGKPNLRIPTAAELRHLADTAAEGVWAIPILLATATGARRGEILGLMWSRVDLDRGRVRIETALQRLPNGKLTFVPPKTERARRWVPLPAFAIERLRFHRVEQARRRLWLGQAWHERDLVCERGDGAPMDPDALSHGFARVAASIGLEGVRLHDCRHGVATALAKSGTPAIVTSKILGHSSVGFTESVYQHPDEEMVERAMRGLEQAFGS